MTFDFFSPTQLKALSWWSDASPYSGTAPAVGYATLAADAAAGKVKTVTSGGAQYLVIKVDTAAGTVGFIM